MKHDSQVVSTVKLKGEGLVEVIDHGPIFPFTLHITDNYGDTACLDIDDTRTLCDFINNNKHIKNDWRKRKHVKSHN
jgi:hypothetical protein